MLNRAFERTIGIDYSGAATPITRSRTLAIYCAEGNAPPQEVLSLLLLLTAAAAAAVYVCCPAQTKGDIRKIASEKLQEFGIPFKAIITWPAARR